MVFYLIVTIFSTLIANGYSVYDLIKNSIINKDFQLSWRFAWMALYIIIYIIDLIMGFILIQFFKFHIKLILENKTTIETLDHKGKEFQSKYDIGVWNNWYQVMGITKWLWFIPLKIYQGKPKGNGIDWVDNDEDLMPSSNRVENNNINDETGNDNYKNRNGRMTYKEYISLRKKYMGTEINDDKAQNNTMYNIYPKKEEEKIQPIPMRNEEKLNKFRSKSKGDKKKNYYWGG
jgi:palmitoyltransferase